MFTRTRSSQITSCAVVPIRHWSPESESYSGGDSLLGALDEGWRLIKARQITQQTLSGRPVTVYIVWLESGEHLAVMRLIGNPYITRLLNEKQHIESVPVPKPLAVANF